MPSVLAIDPGEKVGWATGYIAPDSGDIEVWTHGITPLKPFALGLARSAAAGPGGIDSYDVVIYERWRLNASVAKALIGNDMQTSQLIGMIRLLGWLHDVKLVSQDPKDMAVGASAAPQCVRDSLVTLPKSHDESHDGSALKHLAFYWFRNYFDPQEAPA